MSVEKVKYLFPLLNNLFDSIVNASFFLIEYHSIGKSVVLDIHNKYFLLQFDYHIVNIIIICHVMFKHHDAFNFKYEAPEEIGTEWKENIA